MQVDGGCTIPCVHTARSAPTRVNCPVLPYACANRLWTLPTQLPTLKQALSDLGLPIEGKRTEITARLAGVVQEISSSVNGSVSSSVNGSTTGSASNSNR